jgi:hypothetical protein
MLKNVRLRDANPKINPGWMTQEAWDAEVAKNPKLDRLVRIDIGGN